MIFDLNGTIVIFVVSFLIFMWLLNQIMLKPVGEIIAKRTQLIESDIDSGKKAMTEASTITDKQEQDLKATYHEAHTVMAKAAEEVNRERSLQVERVSKAGQAKLDKAKADINAEREKLIDSLVAEEKELVEIITRKVLGDESVQVSLDNGQVRRTLEER